MKIRTFIASLVAVAAVVAVCDRYLDIPLARACRQHFRHKRLWVTWTADIPDLLFLAVCFITAASLLLYLYRMQKRLFTGFTWFCQHTACAVPVSFALKSALKFLFGRVNTRYWVAHPEAYGFNWFHGSGSFSGFPSGHMAVFATLAAGVWRYYPRLHVLTVFSTLLLGGALIATNYHFLSDVIAGTYLGVCVEACTARILDRQRSNLKETDEL